MVNQRGFNLIELMIVVAIIAILAAIAYPSYQDSVRRTKRADMQTTMLQLAAQIQRYKVANFRVTGATAADLGIATSYPLQGDELYHVKISWRDAQGAQKDTAALGSEKWLLTATPVAATSQAGDGHLVLNHRGERCWQKGTDKPSGSACVPSSETDWNNR